MAISSLNITLQPVLFSAGLSVDQRRYVHTLHLYLCCIFSSYLWVNEWLSSPCSTVSTVLQVCLFYWLVLIDFFVTLIQGGILSPFLFRLYIRDLIVRVTSLNLGCIGHIWPVKIVHNMTYNVFVGGTLNPTALVGYTIMACIANSVGCYRRRCWQN